MLFLDNLNNTAFKSDLLASAITERPGPGAHVIMNAQVPLEGNLDVVPTRIDSILSSDC